MLYQLGLEYVYLCFKKHAKQSLLIQGQLHNITITLEIPLISEKNDIMLVTIFDNLQMFLKGTLHSNIFGHEMQ